MEIKSTFSAQSDLRYPSCGFTDGRCSVPLQRRTLLNQIANGDRKWLDIKHGHYFRTVRLLNSWSFVLSNFRNFGLSNKRNTGYKKSDDSPSNGGHFSRVTITIIKATTRNTDSIGGTVPGPSGQQLASFPNSKLVVVTFKAQLIVIKLKVTLPRAAAY